MDQCGVEGELARGGEKEIVEKKGRLRRRGEEGVGGINVE